MSFFHYKPIVSQCNILGFLSLLGIMFFSIPSAIIAATPPTTIEHLIPTAGAKSGGFGSSVAIGSYIAVIGAQYDDGNITASGVTYIKNFNPTSGLWSLTQTLTAPYAIAQELFGHAIGDKNKVGAAYVFSKDSITGIWSFGQKLTARGDGVGSDLFGQDIALKEDVRPSLPGGMRAWLTVSKQNILDRPMCLNETLLQRLFRKHLPPSSQPNN